jgi:pyruvate kinase
MTSGETAQGQYPINVIKTMKRINQESQNNFCYMNAIEKFNEMASYTKLDSKIKKQCLDIAKLAMPKNSGTNQALFPYECLIIFENNEKLINAISNIRPGASIIAVIDDKKLYNKFGLNYGIFTYLVEDLKTAKANYKKITKNALTHYSINSKKSIAYINNKALKLA